ncbi:MAG: hypothetical protein E7148_07885, partial [Rikenellaceae bacterium]|nr:hypothetical protein [Rikenellaceae bacterium]
DNIYYWTVNGEWLLDENGNKIKAEGKDGKDGENGQNGTNGTNGTNGENGKDGITPQLKIENDYWMISYDNGNSWTQLGKATGEKGEKGEQGDPTFKDITQDENNVYFTLNDGTTITIPMASSYLQSVSFIPKYSDGKATVYYFGTAEGSYAEIDFVVLPKSAVTKLATEWDKALSMKAVNTISRAVDFVDMPILACEADETNGTITVKVSGENLSANFFAGNAAVNAMLFITSNNTEIASGYFPLTVSRRSQYKLEATYTTLSSPNPSVNNKAFLFNSSKGITGIDNPLLLIDYGDGNEGTESGHIYKEAGTYNVTFYFENPITEIGEASFSNIGGCLRAITIPNTVTKIGNSAFSLVLNTDAVGLTSVTFETGSQLETIEYGAFMANSNLTEFTIPASVKSIEGMAFTGCTSLKDIDVASGNPYYYVAGIENGRILLRRENGTVSLVFMSPTTTLTDTYMIFSMFIGRIREISEGAINMCDNLKTASFHSNNTIISIKPANFGNCKNLTTVSFENAQIDSLPNSFFNCPNLQSVTLPSTIKYIEDAFRGCPQLTTLEFPSDSQLEVIDGGFQQLTALEKVSLPASLKSLREYAFQDCSSLKEIEFAQTGALDSIGHGVFQNCTALSTVTIPASVTTIDSGFAGCTALESVQFAENSKLTTIKGDEWYNEGSASGAFAECTSLKTFDATHCTQLNTISNLTFYGCQLTSIKLGAVTPPVFSYEASGFANAQIGTLYVPSGSENAYIDSHWSFTTIDGYYPISK